MRALGVCLLVVGLSGLGAHAQVPERMVFQGRLARSDGQPETAAQNLRFAIYDAATGGTRLWEELHQGVALTNGFYSVVLGTSNTTPLSSVFTGPERYLSVSLDGQAEMLPRLPVSTLPYAFVAGDAQKLGGKDSAQFAASSHSHPSATPTTSGFLSAADKAKLDAVPSVWGNGLTASSGRVDVAFGGDGTATTVSRSDHVHALSCTQRSATAAFDTGALASCNTGEVLTGGGCDEVPTGTGFTLTSAPTASGYSCKGTGFGAPSTPVTAWAVCCRVMP